jgi:hypothetical protein
LPDKAGTNEPGNAPKDDNGDNHTAKNDDSLFHGWQSYLRRSTG